MTNYVETQEELENLDWEISLGMDTDTNHFNHHQLDAIQEAFESHNEVVLIEEAAEYFRFVAHEVYSTY